MTATRALIVRYRARAVFSDSSDRGRRLGGYLRGEPEALASSRRCIRRDWNGDRLLSLHIYTSWPRAEVRVMPRMGR